MRGWPLLVMAATTWRTELRPSSGKTVWATVGLLRSPIETGSLNSRVREAGWPDANGQAGPGALLDRATS